MVLEGYRDSLLPEPPFLWDPRCPNSITPMLFIGYLAHLAAATNGIQIGWYMMLYTVLG